MNKFWELTAGKFFALTLLSHISFLLILITGSTFQIASMFLVAFAILLLSSVPVYHRFLSHRSWKCPRWYEIFASILGIFSFTGSTISRTSIHRMHHAYVDTNKDPHSPIFLPIWKIYFPIFNQIKVPSSLARDLIVDSLHRNIHKYYLLIVMSVFIICFVFFNITWAMALSIAPGAICWANVCILNIFGHVVPGGNNSKLLSLITLGEGNHRYHHTAPTESNTGNTNFDLSYSVIRLLKK